VSSYWCETLLIDGAPMPGVRLEVGADGRIARVTERCEPQPHDVWLGTVLPGMANAHSHAFHRVLRGRTHADGGDFWQWREAMYQVAGLLDPELYFELARAVFAEMLASGYTAVGEFHYLHHRSDGTAYPNRHAMELALARAARAVGIRLVLLDTLYLSGGIRQPLAPEQRAFGDGSATAWLERWQALRTTVADDPEVTVGLGAALHSVRAVPREALREALAGLPPTVPVHIHLSEQPQENTDCLAAYGTTPTGLLASLNGLNRRLSVVHATHLSDADVALLGAAEVTVVMCPTTEADLGDGIGSALRLHRAGAKIALGSDQNAVVDPFLEMRGLEAGERLASGKRGRFTPAELLAAATENGYFSLGLGSHRLRPGELCDLVEIAADSVRTLGSAPGQLPLTATSADVRRVIVHGRVVADSGRLVTAGGTAGQRPEELLRSALEALAALEARAGRDGRDGRETFDARDPAPAPAPAPSPAPSPAPGGRR
jgi:formiminoglutamate deiminase